MEIRYDIFVFIRDEVRKTTSDLFKVKPTQRVMRNYKAENEKRFSGNPAKSLTKKNECVLGFVRLK